MTDGLAVEEQQESDAVEYCFPYDEFKPKEAAGFAAEYTNSFIERLRPRESEA